MKTSESLDELALALSECVFPAIEKKSTARIPTKNGGTYEFSYADLAEIIKITKPSLKANHLAIVQTIDVKEKHILYTRLIHKSGQWVESAVEIPVYSKPQELGAFITYLRRYAYSAIIGVQSEDDVDGFEEVKQAPKTVMVLPLEPRNTQTQKEPIPKTIIKPVVPVNKVLVPSGQHQGKSLDQLDRNTLVEMADKIESHWVKNQGWQKDHSIPEGQHKLFYTALKEEISKRTTEASHEA